MKSLACMLALFSLPCAVALAVPARAAAADDSEVRVVKMELYDTKTNALLYRGVRETKVADGRVTVKNRYTLPDGTEVQRSNSVYDRATLRLVSHEQEDLRTGESEKIHAEGDTLHVHYRENKDAPERTQELRWNPQVASGAVLAALLARNAKSLAEGKPLSFDLIVPSMLETISFRMLKDGDRQLDGKPVTVLRMEPNSWWIRQLVDPMYFYLTNDTPHRLLQYQGRTALRAPNGSEQELRFVYRYPAQG